MTVSLLSGVMKSSPMLSAQYCSHLRWREEDEEEEKEEERKELEKDGVSQLTGRQVTNTACNSLCVLFTSINSPRSLAYIANDENSASHVNFELSAAHLQPDSDTPSPTPGLLACGLPSCCLESRSMLTRPSYSHR